MKVLCVVLVCALFASVYAGSGSVVVLTDEDFNEKTASGLWFIKFFAPWCGHCKRMVPEWEKLASEVKDNDINIAEVDCTVHKDSCGKFGVRGYPTLKTIKDGAEHEKHSGQRTASEFRTWLNNLYPKLGIKVDKKEAPAEEAAEGDVTILGAGNFDEKVKSGAWLVKFYAPWCGHCKRLAPTWSELATAVKGKYNIAKVDCTVHGDLCSKFDIRGYPTIKFLQNGETKDYNGGRELKDFTKFLESNAAGGAAAAGEAAGEAAAKGSTEVTLDEGVPVLTAANFDSAIGNGKWLIKFYAPWCGHCKRMAPAWSELSQKLKAEGNKFNNGKVDCTVHSDLCSKFEVRGYPTILYFENGKKLDNYNGARDVDSFVKYFASKGEHAHDEL